MPNDKEPSSQCCSNFLAIFHPLIAVVSADDDGIKAGRAIALGVGAGGGAAGAGAGIGMLFGKAIESITRQPEMRDEITSSSGWASRSPRPASSTASWAGSSPSSSRNQMTPQQHRPYSDRLERLVPDHARTSG